MGEEEPGINANTILEFRQLVEWRLNFSPSPPSCSSSSRSFRHFFALDCANYRAKSARRETFERREEENVNFIASWEEKAIYKLETLSFRQSAREGFRRRCKP
jgi:hypothetical protein